MPVNHKISAATIRGLWNNWAIAFGAISLVTLFDLFVPKNLLPVLVLSLSYLLSVKIKLDNGKTKMGACHMPLWATAIILFWSGIVMLVINLLHARWFFGGMLSAEPFNPQHPYVSSLILFPVALVVSLFFLLRKQNLRVCRVCMARFGYYSQGGPVAPLYYHEARYQLKLLLMLSLLLSVVDWLYYHFFYINVNYNRPDKFYFIAMPVIVYLLSVIYMAVRYMSITDEISDMSSKNGLRPMRTKIRFLIVSDDRLFLKEDSDGLIDTPAKIIIPRRDSVSKEEADKMFTELSGIESFESKFLFDDTGYVNGSNVMHYAVFLSDDRIPANKLGGSWNTIDRIDRLIKSHEIAPMLLREIARIYRITMAWKTYDREGRRLYPIKHYRPTFRISDFKKWDVDYGDLHWLDVATNNEDRPFFKVRRLWRKKFRH